MVSCSGCGAHGIPAKYKFCPECGDRLTGAPPQGAVGGNDHSKAKDLIHPVLGAAGGLQASAIPCPYHPKEDANGFCDPCADVVCIKCLTHKPIRHTDCGPVSSLKEVLTGKNPFLNTLGNVSDAEKAVQELMQKVTDSIKYRDEEEKREISKLKLMKSNAISKLERQYEEELNKLKKARDAQKQHISDAVDRKITELQDEARTKTSNLKKDLTRTEKHLQELKQAGSELSVPFQATYLCDLVVANKEAVKLLADCDASTLVADDTGLTNPGASDEADLETVSELPVSVQLNAKREDAWGAVTPFTPRESATAAGQKTRQPQSMQRRREAITSALALGSEHKFQADFVPVPKEYVDHCRAFASGHTQTVPGPLPQVYEDDTYILVISRKSAEALAAALGGRVTMSVACRHGAFVLEFQASHQIVAYAVLINNMSNGQKSYYWAAPHDLMESSLVKKLGRMPRRVQDVAGNNVNTIQKWEAWWPSAACSDKTVKVLNVYF